MKLPFSNTKYRYIRYGIVIINYYILGGKREMKRIHDKIRDERHKKGLNVNFKYDIPEETDEWKEWYIPPSYINKDDLILDVGGRDGDTVLFYAEHGYTNIRVIEPKEECRELLDKNCKEITHYFGTKIEIRNKLFTKEDLIGVKFAKFDCEGCEYEIDISKLGIPVVAELHENIQKDENGIYKTNSRWLGYLKTIWFDKQIKSVGYVRYNYGS